MSEPDGAVGPDGGIRDRARLVDQGRHVAGREVRPQELLAARGLVEEQERARVRPPVAPRDGARQVGQRHSLARAGLEVPDGRALGAGDLLGDHQPAVARDRGPAGRRQGPALVELVAGGCAGAHVQDPQGRPLDVPALGVPDTHERAVGGQTARPRGVLTAHARRLGVPVQLSRRLAVDRHDHPVVVIGGQADRDGAGHEGQARRPAVGGVGEQRCRLAAAEGGDEPAAPLVADGIEPPHDARAVGQQMDLLGAHALGRGLPSLAGLEIPRPRLRRTALGRHDADAVGTFCGPGDDVDLWRQVPKFPRRQVGHRTGCYPLRSAERDVGRRPGVRSGIAAPSVPPACQSPPRDGYNR